MIKILHGDNIAASRNAFTLLRQGANNPVMLRGGMFTLTDLVQIFEGGELFGSSKDIFIEELFARVKKGEELSTYADYLTKQASQNAIVLWEPKALTNSQLKFLKNATAELFKLPTTLFTFLDGLRPENATFLIAQAQKVMSDTGDEILLSMLIRHIRLLLALRTRAETEEVKRLAPWQKTKLVNQSLAFTTDHLILLHQELCHLDTARKTGTSSQTLSASIDFFLLRL